MRVDLNRLLAGVTVTEPDVKQFAKGVYVRVMEKNSTMSEATELGVLRTCQLVWYLAQQIVAANLNVPN